MKLYDDITKDSILHEVNRICGSDFESYSIRDQIARGNAGLDKYFHLAFQADGRHNFDDINESSPPIDTQGITISINRYKFSGFTEKIMGLIKLTVLDTNGIEIDLIPEEIGDLTGSFLQIYKSGDAGVGVGVPSHYLKYGDFIYLRPSPNYTKTYGLRAYFNRPLSKFGVVTCTISSETVTATAHGLSINDTVIFETDGALPTGLSIDTVYYVVATVAANSFSVALTKGGTKITTSNSQSGILYFIETSKVPGIPVVHHPYLSRFTALPFLIEKSLPQVNSIRKLIGSDNPRDPFYGGDELAIVKFFARRSKDIRSVIGPHITPFR